MDIEQYTDPLYSITVVIPCQTMIKTCYKGKHQHVWTKFHKSKSIILWLSFQIFPVTTIFVYFTVVHTSKCVNSQITTVYDAVNSLLGARVLLLNIVTETCVSEKGLYHDVLLKKTKAFLLHPAKARHRPDTENWQPAVTKNVIEKLSCTICTVLQTISLWQQYMWPFFFHYQFSIGLFL